MENKTSPWELTLREVISSIFRQKIILIITFISIISLTIIGLQFKTPIYNASVKLLIRGRSLTVADTYRELEAWRIHLTQVAIVKSEPVLKRAAIALDLPNRPLDYEKNYCSILKKLYIGLMAKKTESELSELPIEESERIRLLIAIENLKSRLEVNLLPNTDIFIINVKGFSPEEAIEAANVISRSYTIFDQQQQLAEIKNRYGEYHPTVVQLKDNINNSINNLSGKTLPDIEAIGTASVKIIEQASSNYEPVGKSKKIILFIAIFMAVFLGLGLAIMFDLFDNTIKSPQDIAMHLDIACIGTIPRRRQNFLITQDTPQTLYTQFYEDLADQLYIFLKTQGLQSALITSPSFTNNHQFVIPNIGYYFSKILGHKTLLIDANFHEPHFQKIYPLSKIKAINHNTEGIPTKYSTYTIDNKLDILMTEKLSQKPSSILKEFDLKKIINDYKKNYEIVLLDATLVNNMNDASSISECTDGAIIIIDEGKQKKQMIKNSLTIIKNNGIKIIGSILFDRTFPIPDFIYKRL